LKEIAQHSAVDWAKADSQLPEGADARPSLKQCAVSTETWGTAALDQRRKRSRDHLARIAPRREGWIKHNSYYYKLLGVLFWVDESERVFT